MFLPKKTNKSTENYSDKLERLRAELETADAVLIGAGSGLSTAAGFDKGRLFYTQGDYGLFQCSEPCCQETFDNEEVVREMVERQRNMRVPEDLIPLLADDCREPQSGLRLRKPGRSLRTNGNHRPFHLHQCRYWEGTGTIIK